MNCPLPLHDAGIADSIVQSSLLIIERRDDVTDVQGKSVEEFSKVAPNSFSIGDLTTVGVNYLDPAYHLPGSGSVRTYEKGRIDCEDYVKHQLNGQPECRVLHHSA